MDFVASKFDIKSFARKLNKSKEADEQEKPNIYLHYVSIKDLKPCFLKMYSDLIKHDGMINIREVDFGSFEMYDLDDFYTFLETGNHEIFDFGETFLSFKSAVTSKPVFI